MRMRWLAGIVVMWIGAPGVLAGGPDLNGAIRPITNPVYLDLPTVGTSVHPVFMHQELPSTLNTTLGSVPVDGDFQVYALQFEFAVNDNLSIIAVKDGYIDFNPDDTLSSGTGWGDLAAGVKWAFYRNEERQALASARLVAELPTGSDDVWQGNGDGTIDPAASGIILINDLQLIGTAGFIVAIDTDEESSFFYDAWHASYKITDRFFPLIELNHFLVIDEGAGVKQFDKHVDGGVPAIARFEGADLVNLGAVNAGDNENLLTLGIGARVRLTDAVDIGGAYEIPLTDEENGLIDSRVTLDLVWDF